MGEPVVMWALPCWRESGGRLAAFSCEGKAALVCAECQVRDWKPCPVLPSSKPVKVRVEEVG